MREKTFRYGIDMNTGQKIFLALIIGAIILGLFFMFRTPERMVPQFSRTDRGDENYLRGNVQAAIRQYKHSTNPEAKITEALIIANDLGDFERAENILAHVAENFPEYTPDIEEIVQTFDEERDRQYLQDTLFDAEELDILFQDMLIQDAQHRTTPEVETPIRNDPQNVHDHFVQNDFRNNLTLLKTETSTPKHSNASISSSLAGLAHPDRLAEFEQYIDNDEAAKKVYKHIQDLSKADINDALDILRRSLEMAKNEEEFANICNEMKLELRSALGPGGIVCSTGIKTRILGAVEVIDDRFKLRPEWAMREEISGKVAQYRENILSKYTDAERTLYNSGNEVLEERVRTEAKKMFEDEYKDILKPEDRERFNDLFTAL